MPTINYYLDKPDRKNQSPILLSYILKGGRFRFYTKLKIEEASWDNQKQEAKKSKEGYEEINSILEGYKEIIKQIEEPQQPDRQGFDPYSLRAIMDRFHVPGLSVAVDAW